MQRILDKAKNIKLVIFDVDGVLTTGQMIYGSQGNEYKSFHVQDGFGIRLLLRSKIDVAVITAKTAESVAQRMQDLGIQYYYPGQDNKRLAYDELKQKLNLSDQQIAYLGDDLPDLPILRQVGLAVSVPNAPSIIHQYVDWITTHQGGQGAVRELCEVILNAQDLYAKIVEGYL